MLEREQALLLTERVGQFLAGAIELARQSDDAQIQQRAANLEAHLMLLSRARQVGIDAACAEFEAARHAAEEPAGNEGEANTGESGPATTTP